ncbi:MAG: SDR family NAD(P)-dependent oxidoreductase [Geminicoccaceae bacterium]
MNVLLDKVAIVTGAARGIGLAISRRFASEGARVAMLDHNEASLNEAAATIGDKALPLVADIGDPFSVRNAVGNVITTLGEIKILVNNAAAASVRAKITELSPEAWDQALRINLTGAFLMSREVIPSMQRAGQGVIINIASQLGSVAVQGGAAYCATKGAILQFTKALALDHAADGIRVNSLSPGAVLTPRLTDLYGTEDAAEAALSPKHPIGRIGRPADIAGAAVFLASDESRFMTGADLVVDGGYTAQ